MPNPTSPTAIVVSEYLMDPYLQRLAAKAPVVYDPDLYADRTALLDAAANARAIVVRNRTRVDAELLGVATRLRAVGRLGVGLDNIDLDACDRAGVAVLPAIGGNSVSVAEYVVGAMMNLARGVYGMTSSMVAGEWPRQGHAFGVELAGKTLGLVGFGSIARLLAKRGGALEMTVIAHDPYVPDSDPAWADTRSVSFEDLLTVSDVVSLHTALTPETTNLIDEAALARMKKGAFLINTSRGGTIDENAVAAALRSGRLGGAALDVFSDEPLGPEGGAVFAGLDNLILTPHVAGNTHESVHRVADMTVSAVLDHLA